MDKRSICHEATFDEIFMKYADSLRSLMYYKCGNWEQAEDWTQEAFMKLWMHCSKVPVEKAWSYVFTVANNFMYNQNKRKSVILKFLRSHALNNETNTPEFLLKEKEFLNKLEGALSKLTPAQREAFLLNRIEDKTYKEIANILGISVKAVEKRIHKALISLRNEIKEI